MKKAGYLLAFLGLLAAGPASAAASGQAVPAENDAKLGGRVRPETCRRPEYPEEERRQNHEGPVTLRFLVSKDGVVKRSSVETSSGYPALDEAARVAIAKCRFHPAIVDGVPREAWTAIQFVWDARAPER